MFDEKHRITLFSSAGPSEDYMRQTGFWEYLLCQSCESKLSLWERYAEPFLSSGAGAEARVVGKLIYVSGLDYAKMKLFQLSILWRASVAEGDFFSKVQLGPLEETLRLMLLSSDPGHELKFPCLMFALHLGGQSLRGLISPPVSIRINGVRGYRFVFGGFLWGYLVTAQRVPDSEALPIIRADGRLLFIFGNGQEMEDLQKFMKARPMP